VRRGTRPKSAPTERGSGTYKAAMRRRQGSEASPLSEGLTVFLEPGIGLGPGVRLLAGWARRPVVAELACVPAPCIRLEAGGDAFARHMTPDHYARHFDLLRPGRPIDQV
jgi:hypothetical protein